MKLDRYDIDANQLTDDDFEVIRSDQGDGGWSIHWKHDEEDEDGLTPVLVSGPADWLSSGEWNRPNKEDFADAIDALVKRDQPSR